MLDLLAQLYDIDALRFPLWDLLDTLNLDGIVAKGIDLAGLILHEDWSVSPKQ